MNCDFKSRFRPQFKRAVFQPRLNLQGNIFALEHALLGKLIPAANSLFDPEMALSCVPSRKVSFIETRSI